jgi:hypothetical protein
MSILIYISNACYVDRTVLNDEMRKKLLEFSILICFQGWVMNLHEVLSIANQLSLTCLLFSRGQFSDDFNEA